MLKKVVPTISILLLSLFFLFSPKPKIVIANETIEESQKNSVTITTECGSGSGVLVTRPIRTKDNVENITFVITAAHIITDDDGNITRNPTITQDIAEDDEIVGHISYLSKVISYSDENYGCDIAVLQILKKNAFQGDTQFKIDKERIAVGTHLYTVGSPRGIKYSNTVTTGILSAIGRRIETVNDNYIVMDQTTCPVYPGSSGGGIYTSDGKCIGIIVRTLNPDMSFFVPIRIIIDHFTKRKIMWLLNPNLPTPLSEELN